MRARDKYLINRLKDLVINVYPATFKIFNINSENLIFNPKLKDRFFISFGLTTSLQSLKGLFKDLQELDKSLNLEIVEVVSKKLSMQHLNSVISVDPDQQYIAELNENVLNKEQAEETLKTLSESELKTKLNNLIQSLNTTESWNRHYVLFNEEKNICQLFHKYVNYKIEDNLEYRIGILVKF